MVAIALVSVAAIVDSCPPGVTAKSRPASRANCASSATDRLACDADERRDSASLFAVFTYIRADPADGGRHLAERYHDRVLLFGVGITIGNLVGGRLADWRLMETIMGALGLLALVLLQFAVSSHFAPAAAATVFRLGRVFFVLIPPLQMRVTRMRIGGAQSRIDAQQGAFNLGNALGAGSAAPR